NTFFGRFRKCRSEERFHLSVCLLSAPRPQFSSYRTHFSSVVMNVKKLNRINFWDQKVKGQGQRSPKGQKHFFRQISQVSLGRALSFVCLFVCVFVCLSAFFSETTGPISLKF
ncbi:MAG: hypothetical protein AAGM12_16810, partial [Pseudomonadota bacterium]